MSRKICTIYTVPWNCLVVDNIEFIIMSYYGCSVSKDKLFSCLLAKTLESTVLVFFWLKASKYCQLKAQVVVNTESKTSLQYLIVTVADDDENFMNVPVVI